MYAIINEQVKMIDPPKEEERVKKKEGKVSNGKY